MLENKTNSKLVGSTLRTRTRQLKMRTVELKIVLIVSTAFILFFHKGSLTNELSSPKIVSNSSRSSKFENRFTMERVSAKIIFGSHNKFDDSIGEKLKKNLNNVTVVQLQNDDSSSQNGEKAITPMVSVDSLLSLSQELAYSRNFVKAESILDIVLEDNPNNTDALYQLAVVLSWDGKYDKSIQAYKRLYKLQPENHGLLLEMAKVRLWQGDKKHEKISYKQAAKLLETYLESNSSNLIALRQLGYAYLRCGRLSDAFRILSSALEKDPEDIESEYLLGQTLAHQGEYKEAEQDFKEILDKHPQANEVRLSYADLLSWMSLYQEAAKQYLLILDSDPYNLGALAGLGRLKSWEGDFSSAEAYYNSALSHYPSAEGPLLEIANLKMWQHKRNEAVDCYKKALRVNPNNRFAKRGLEKALWLTSSTITLVSGYFEDTRAYKRYWVGGNINFNISEDVALQVGYLNWAFSEPETPTLYRHDATISLQYHFSRWLEGVSSFTSSVFSHQEDGISLRWASSLTVTPVRSFKLYFSYGRSPYAENLTVVRNNYSFDSGGIGLDWQLAKWLSTQLNVNRSWFKGTYSFGYYDTGINRWITLGNYQDHSTKEEIAVQASSRILNQPKVDLKHKYLTVDYKASDNVPYWAPSDLRQHVTTIAIGTVIHDRLELGMECRGIYTEGEKELGFGVSGLFQYRLGKVLQTEFSIGYDHVHIDLPWEGLGASFSLRFRL